MSCCLHHDVYYYGTQCTDFKCTAVQQIIVLKEDQTKLLFISQILFSFSNAVEDTVKEFFGEWEWIFSAKNRLPYCAGMFKIGHQLGGGGGSVGEVEVVYIGHTTQDRTLREVLSSVRISFVLLKEN